MPKETTVTPKRIRKIIEAEGKLKTFAQIADYRKTLLPEEVEALEVYLQSLPETEKQEAIKPLEEAWAGITKGEIFAYVKEREEERELLARAAVLKKPEPTKVPPPKQPTVKPDLIIQRTPYPKWWNDEGIAKIALTSPGSQFVITARGDYSLYIATIVLTVSGECTVSFGFGSAGSSGTMNFGGEDEPRGIVIATGNSPTPCGSGSFMITASSDEAVTIGGFVAYYLWKKESK